MNDTTTNTNTDSQATGDETTHNQANTPQKKRKRLDGPVVFDRVQREVLTLRRVIEGYRVRREPDSEDEITKDVFDALDDLGRVAEELQGIVEVLEHRVYAQRPDPVGALRKKKRNAAERRRGESNPDVHRYRVAKAVMREAEAS